MKNLDIIKEVIRGIRGPEGQGARGPEGQRARGPGRLEDQQASGSWEGIKQFKGKRGSRPLGIRSLEGFRKPADHQAIKFKNTLIGSLKGK